MTEITDEMIDAGCDALFDLNTEESNVTIARAVIKAVAPLIEAQARAEDERHLRFCDYCKAWNSKPCGEGCVWTPDMPTKLPSAELAQARAAAIEEAAKVAEGSPAFADDVAALIRALSRPVSEREGGDTAPAPAISGGEKAMDRIVAELKWIVAHAGFPRSRGEIVDRAKFAIALAAADRSAS